MNTKRNTITIPQALQTARYWAIAGDFDHANRIIRMAIRGGATSAQLHAYVGERYLAACAEHAAKTEAVPRD